MKNTVDSCVYFDIGARVLVGEKAKMPGVLRYLGTVHFVEGIWCGVELDEEEGLHDGMVQGTRYFTCPPNKGVLAPLCRVQPMTCSSLERNRNHGVLFDCPFEDVPQSSPSRSSRLPRPAYAASTRHCDKILPGRGQHKSFDVECLLDVKNQEVRMRKSASPKKVTFDMEPEFVEDDSEFRWKKSRSEYDSLHSFENEINCNFQEERNMNSLKEDLVNFNCHLTTSGDIKPCIAIRPKSVSASLDAVESDLNELLQKIDKEISNVKTPDTAEIGILAPDFFVAKSNKKHAMKQEIDFFQDDDDYMDGISSERSDKLRDQRKVDEAGDDDIMLLTGSPTFRLAQTAMVQYAELLKASQAGLVAQKIRYQSPNKSNKIMSDTNNSSSSNSGKVAVGQSDSPLKIRRFHLDSSNSTSSSNDDVYETFEGEDLCTLKIPANCELNCNEPASSMAMSLQNIETAASNQSEATSEDVCNFLDSLLKSGQELEKWLEISVADLKSDADTSEADSCKIETKDESPKAIENCVHNKDVRDVERCTETNSVTGIEILSQSDILLEDISKTRPLSYASTVDSSDTGCQMELDEDITKSFNVEESLIDLGTQSDSLLLESWNEIFRPDTAQQRIESIERSVLDYLDLGAIESTAQESSEIVQTSTNLIEFDCEIRHNVHLDSTPLAVSNDDELKAIQSLAESEINLSNLQHSKEIYPIPSSNAKRSYSSAASAENNVLLINEVKNMNYSFDNLQLSSIQTFVDEATSDSQEANASGLSSTPGSSFSSYASSHKDQDLLPHDGSLDGCLLNSIEETFIHLDEPTSSVITNSLVNGIEDDDDDDDNDDYDNDYDDDEYVSWKKLETNDDVSDPVAPLEPFVSDESKSHLKDDPDKVNLDEPCKEMLQTPASSPSKSDNPAVKSATLKNSAKKAQTNIGSKPPLKVSTNLKNLVNQTKSSKMSLPKVVNKSRVEKPSGKVESEAKTFNSSDSRTKKPIHQSQTKVSSSTKSVSPRASKFNTLNSMSSSLTSQTSTGLSNRTVFARSQPQNSVTNTSAKSSNSGSSSKQTKSFIPSAREVKQNSIKPTEKVDTKLTATKSEPNKGLEPVKDVVLSSASTLKKRGLLFNQKSTVLTNGRRQIETEEIKRKQNLRSGSAASKIKTPGNSKLNLKDSNNPVNHSTLPAKKPLLSGKQVSNGSVKSQLHVPKGSLDSKALKNAKNTTMASGKKVTLNDSLISEVTELKNQLNEAKKLADQYQKESKDFERLVSTQEKQYKERITRFEKALEERLAWLKGDLEMKHDSFVKELTDRHECDMLSLKEASQAKTIELEKAFEEAKASYEKELNDVKAERNKTIADLNKNHARDMKELKQEYEDTIRCLEDRISSVQKALDKSLARERTAQEAAKLDRDLRQQALLEIDSLGVVVESKNSELKKMRMHATALEEKLNEIPALKEKMVSMQRKIEQLEMALASKTEHEKELLDTKQKLLKKSKEGDEAVRKLSMNNEELIWRLSQSELGSPILKDRHPFSPTHSPISPMSKSAISFSTPIRK